MPPITYMASLDTARWGDPTVPAQPDSAKAASVTSAARAATPAANSAEPPEPGVTIISPDVKIISPGARASVNTANLGPAGATATSFSTAAPETANPQTTAPEATAPETTAPETTAPETTAPETAAPETAAPEARQRARAAGLDGLRALAVLAVLAFHLNLPWAPGGFLGVDVFFVLSGYLITDLLVSRYGRDNTVGLRVFWIRRARRLLPPLALMLVVVTAAIAVTEPDQMASLRPALAGAVSYTSNWWQAFAHQSYFDLYGPPPALQHLWSLAVEEQFYLLWPLLLVIVLAVLRRPVYRSLVAWAGAAASALAMLAIYVPDKDPSLVYYGTDTHASALMIGAALALTWPLASMAKVSRTLRLDVIGMAGLLVLGWAFWHLSGANPLVYPLGLVIAALAAGGVVLAAAAPGRIASALSFGPLRWIGVRSYGIYLWHWPVIAITGGLAVRAASSLPARLIDIVLPIAIAAASWRWLEDPILRQGTRAVLKDRGKRLWYAATAGWPSRATAVPLVAALAALAVTATAGYGLVHRQTGTTLQQQIDQGASLIRQAQRHARAGNGHSAPAPWKLATGTGPFAENPVPAPPPPPVPGWKVMALGDSVMLACAPELARALPGISIDAKVSRQMYTGVSMIQQLAASSRLRPVVIIGLGTNGTVTLDQIEQILHAIGHRWLILINTYVPRPWEQSVNAAIAAAAKRFPNVLMVNWHSAIQDHTSLLWGDGIHPQPVGGVLYANVLKTAVMTALAHPPVFPPAAPSPSATPGQHPGHSASGTPSTSGTQVPSTSLGPSATHSPSTTQGSPTTQGTSSPSRAH